MHNKDSKYNSLLETTIIVIFIVIMSVFSILVMTDIISLPSQLTIEEKLNFAKNNTYSENRYDYDSDATFANFRAINVGKIKKNTFYRGASPYLDYNRTIYVNKLLTINNIRNFISLSEHQEQILEYTNKYPVSNYYFSNIYHNDTNSDIALGFDHIDIINEIDINKMIPSFQKIINSEGKTYIHCQIGRDRTGAYCILLESLADASYEEIVDDYMKSFESYHFINKENTPEIYQEIKNSRIDTLLKKITGLTSTSQLQSSDLHKCVKELLHKSGMTYEEVNELTRKICE